MHACDCLLWKAALHITRTFLLRQVVLTDCTLVAWPEQEHTADTVKALCREVGSVHIEEKREEGEKGGPLAQRR